MEEAEKLTADQNQIIAHAISDMVLGGFDNERAKNAAEFMVAQFIELNKKTHVVSLRRMM